MKALSLLCALCVGAVVLAAPPLPIAPEARIEPGQAQTFTLSVSAEALQQKLALSLLARLDSPGLGGSTFAMGITVNGKAVERKRLLNKPPETEMLSGLKLDWFGQGGWRVCYSPDYERANREDHSACLVGGHAYDFVLDVSDLLHPGADQIVIRHAETRIKSALVLRDVALVAAPVRVAPPDEQPEDPNAPLGGHRADRPQQGRLQAADPPRRRAARDLWQARSGREQQLLVPERGVACAG